MSVTPLESLTLGYNRDPLSPTTDMTDGCAGAVEKVCRHDDPVSVQLTAYGTGDECMSFLNVDKLSTEYGYMK